MSSLQFPWMLTETIVPCSRVLSFVLLGPGVAQIRRHREDS
uniref:Uncharacterized protein n=1 Tax=Arundo donax TaxID=35708 RepID=A0A0A8ZYV5_ARUDO